MATCEKTTDLLERVARAETAQSAIEMAASHWALHVTYHAPQVVPGHSDAPFVASTYPPEWLTHYLLKGYAKIDPIVRMGTEVVLPFDWSEIEVTGPVMDLMMDAVAHGLGPVGYTVPLRDRAGRPALYSLNGSLDPDDWAAFLVRERGLILELAELTHQAALGERYGDTPMPVLTGREKEVLSWLARGKTAEETGVILGLSINTVRAYIKSARYKLGSGSTMQAITTALQQRIIDDV